MTLEEFTDSLSDLEKAYLCYELMRMVVRIFAENLQRPASLNSKECEVICDER